MAAFMQARQGPAEVVDIAIKGRNRASSGARIEDHLARAKGVLSTSANSANAAGCFESNGKSLRL